MMKSELKLQQRNVIQTHKKPSPIIAIKNLTWKPARISNDKIYDIWVEFDFTAKNGAKRAYITLKPLKYANLPANIFPYENDRQISINLYGVKNGAIKVRFNNLKGGREYNIKVELYDLKGKGVKKEIKTTYIREYENLAKQLKTIVMTPYYLWYRKDLSNWRDGHKYMPLLGEYRSNDPIVMSKHIDWATGHGIKCFMVSWSGLSDDNQYFDNNLKLLFNNPLINDIKISLLYESTVLKTTGNPEAPWEKDLSDPENQKKLLTHFEYLSRNYFIRSQFFRLNSEPFIYLYDSAAYIGNVKDTITHIREQVKSIIKEDIFLVSDHAQIIPITSNDPYWNYWFENAKQFDGITSWLGEYSGNGEYLGGSYEKQAELLYSKWSAWAKKNNKVLIPYITPEFDDRYVNWGNPNSIPLERTPEKFKKRLEIALKHCDPIHKIIFVGTWNDFFESTTLEPSKEYGFTYLRILKESLIRFENIGNR